MSSFCRHFIMLNALSLQWVDKVCQQCSPQCFCTCFSSSSNAVEGCRWPGPMRMTRCLGNKKKSKLEAKLTLSVLFCIIFVLSLQQSSICHNAFSLAAVSCRTASARTWDCLIEICTHMWVSSMHKYLSLCCSWNLERWFLVTSTALPNRLLCFPVASFFPSCGSLRRGSYNQCSWIKRYSISAICRDSGHLQSSDAHLHKHRVQMGFMRSDPTQQCC